VRKVRLCRISGLLATDQCYLPVIEEAPFDPDNPDAPDVVVREGGVYEDLRPGERLPDRCPLPHGFDVDGRPDER
jgi:hypothetical protein